MDIESKKINYRSYLVSLIVFLTMIGFGFFISVFLPIQIVDIKLDNGETNKEVLFIIPKHIIKIDTLISSPYKECRKSIQNGSTTLSIIHEGKILDNKALNKLNSGISIVLHISRASKIGECQIKVIFDAQYANKLLYVIFMIIPLLGIAFIIFEILSLNLYKYYNRIRL